MKTVDMACENRVFEHLSRKDDFVGSEWVGVRQFIWSTEDPGLSNP